MDLPQKKKIQCNNTPELSIKKKKNAFWHIDKEMFRFKLHFFLMNGALGASVPYVSVLARNRIGFHATSMAAMIVSQRFLFMFTKPFIGYLADYFKKLKAIICILIVIQGLCFFLLLTIPHVGVDTENMPYTFELNLTYEKANITVPNYMCRDLERSENVLLKQLFRFNDLDTAIYCSFTNETSISSKKGGDDFHSATSLHLPAINFSNKHQLKSCDEMVQTQDITNSPFTIHFLEEKIFNEPTNSTASNLCMFCDTTNHCCESPCIQITDENANFESAENGDFRTYQYWTFAFMSVLASASTNGLFTLCDTACCETVQKTGADFGRQRMWAAIGWGVMSPIAGFLNDYTDNYITAFTFAAVLSMLSLWNLSKMELVQPHFSKSILKDVGAVWKSKEFVLFEAGVLLHGIGIGFVWFNLIWFLTEIGGSRFLCGLSLFMQCIVGDIPFMFFSGWLINKAGHFNVLTLALVTYFVRFIAYSQIGNPWYILPFECLHGLTYGSFMPAMASFAKMNAKPGTEATTQAILFATHEGLGAGIGSVLAGLGFDHLGGQQTYFYASMFAGVSTIISIVFTMSIKIRKRDFEVASSPEKFPQANIALS